MVELVHVGISELALVVSSALATCTAHRGDDNSLVFLTSGAVVHLTRRLVLVVGTSIQLLLQIGSHIDRGLVGLVTGGSRISRQR